MAARVACVVALGGAVAQASAAEPEADSKQPTVGQSHPVADALRVSPQSGSCFSPPTWGPPAPPAHDLALAAAFLGAEA
jgi:hypothetical protein